MNEVLIRRAGFSDSEIVLLYKALDNGTLFLRSKDPVICSLYERLLVATRELGVEYMERKRIQAFQNECVAEYSSTGRIKNEANRFN